MLSNFGLSGGGFSGGGFGRAPANDTAPLNQYLGAPQAQPAQLGLSLNPLDWFGTGGNTSDPWAPQSSGTSQQAAGVYQVGSIWTSKNCPPCGQAIWEMQAQINRVARALNLGVNIATDSKVGAKTVAAFQAVAKAAVARGAVSGTMLLAYTTPELIAKNADKARDLLRHIGDQLGAVAAATAPTTIQTVNPPSGGSPTPYQPPAPPPGFQPAKPGFFSQKNLPFIVGGVILAVGIGAAVMIMRPSTPATE